MGDFGEIGWYLKLESVNTHKISIGGKREKQKERIRQPLFQFRYDPTTGTFIRELKEAIYIDNAAKNPNFVNGNWQNMLDEPEEPLTPTYKP